MYVRRSRNVRAQRGKIGEAIAKSQKRQRKNNQVVQDCPTSGVCSTEREGEAKFRSWTRVTDERRRSK